jgi:hypothetical protein
MGRFIGYRSVTVSSTQLMVLIVFGEEHKLQNFSLTLLTHSYVGPDIPLNIVFYVLPLGLKKASHSHLNQHL